MERKETEQEEERDRSLGVQALAQDGQVQREELLGDTRQQEQEAQHPAQRLDINADTAESCRLRFRRQEAQKQEEDHHSPPPWPSIETSNSR